MMKNVKVRPKFSNFSRFIQFTWKTIYNEESQQKYED